MSIALYPYPAKIVGIDPSLTATGIATTDNVFMVIKDNKLKGDDRLPFIQDTIDRIIQGADLVVMEDLPFNAMSAGATGMAQGVIRAALRKSRVPYVLVSPATLKKAATDKGNAKKDVMVAAWNAAFPDHPFKISQNDMVDAGFLREIGKEILGHTNKLVNTECLAKLAPQIAEVVDG